MYSTCLFCHSPLGENESIEHFPIGRRLAFDSERGRLWVVCRKCEKWNLSPLEERWEAIEECERFYRATRLRAATDNIGLAKLRDGTELVRIGRPLRPEFAAWRYGDQFGRRRRIMFARTGLVLGAMGAVMAGGAALGASLGGAWYGLYQLSQRIIHGSPNQVIARLTTPNGTLAPVRRRDLQHARLTTQGNEVLNLHVVSKDDHVVYSGEEAIHAAGILLPAANRYGGSRQQVTTAVDSIEGAGGSEPFLLQTARRSARELPIEMPRRRRSKRPRPALGLTTEIRLAAEMAANEESERRALEGELVILEEAWRRAEEIAHISDNLLLPEDVTEQLSSARDGLEERKSRD